MLSNFDIGLFPRPGQDHTSIFQVFEAFANNSHRSQSLSQSLLCDCGRSEIRSILRLSGACGQSVWINAARRINFEYTLDNASVQLFIDLQIAAKIRQGLTSPCDECRDLRRSSVFLANPSPWFFIRIPPNVCPRPEISDILELRGDVGIMEYQLFGIVYYNGSHFVGAWADEDGSCWGYDGLTRGGHPEWLELANLAALRSYSGCKIHLVLYSLRGSTPIP